MRVSNEQDMILLGEKLGGLLQGGMCILLEGDLGAGKTTMTKGIGKGLGVTRVINSPTFTILKTYHGRLTLNHFDAYRLEDSDDDLGFEDIFAEDDAVSVIEWPRYIEDILPKESLLVTIHKDGDGREVTFTPTGTLYEALVKEMEQC